MDDFINSELEGLDELYHHGIKGMKWGVRRTPAQLGHRKKKKNAAKKLVEDAWKKHKEKKAAKKAAEEEAAAKKKKPSEMTDAELKRRIERGRLEREALQLDSDISRLSPKQASKGKDIAKKFIDDAVIPAATDAGKQYLTKILKDKLGLSEKKQKSLKEQAEEAKAEFEKEFYKNKLKKEKDEQKAAEKAEKEAKKAEKAEKEAERKAEKDIEDRIRDIEAKIPKDPDSISGADTNRASDRGSNYVKDRVYVNDYSVSDVSTSTRSAGQALLNSPRILALPAPALPAPKDD